MKKLSHTLFAILTMLLSINSAFSQCTPDVKKDTVKIVSINYIDNENESKAQLFYYAYYDNRLYNITDYLVIKKNDCLPPNLKNLDVVPSSNKIVERLLRSKLERLPTVDKNKFKKFIGWSCIDIYASFFIFPCKEGGFLNPLEKFIEHDNSICFTSFFSTKLKESLMPKKIFEHLKSD